MKTRLTVFCALGALLIGCSSQSSSTSSSTQQSTANKSAKVDPEDKPPFIGMTKAQAVARYGQPKTHTITDEGERWTYVLNMGEFIGKHMIPFFFSTQGLRFGILIFGPDGRVKKFNWDVPEND